MKTGKKSLALTLAVLMVMSVLVGYGDSLPVSSDSTVNKTAYKGVAKGLGGDVEVTIQFDGNKIVSVTAKGDKETPGIGSKAIAELPKRILQANSADVAVVSGATVTSNAVIEAAKSAIAQSKGLAGSELPKLVMKPGTYVGEAKGFAGIVVATVKVSKDAIESIKLDKKINTDSTVSPASPAYALQRVAVEELDQIFFDVQKLLPQRIIKSQSLAVDTITGATGSSNGAILAIKEAIKKAGGDPAALNRKIAKSTAKETYNTDVVVVGGGTSGATAAAQAKQLGAKVVLIEKSARIGGTGGLSAGPMALNSDVQLKGGYKADEQQYFDHYMELMNWSIKGSLMSQLVSKIKDTIGFLNSHGFEIVPDTSDFAKTHGGAEHLVAYKNLPYSGMEVRNYFETMVKDVDVILRETTGRELITDANGKVTGVKAVKDDGTEVTVNAKEVIVATGGFGGNKAMMQEKLGATYNLLGVHQNDGSGLKMMLNAGAQEYRASTICSHAIGIPGEVSGFNGFDRAIPYTLITSSALLQVNGKGERFMNEEIQDYDMTRGSVYHASQGSYYYALLSQKQVDAIAAKGTSAAGQLNNPMAFSFQYNSAGKDVPLKNIQAVLDKAVEEDLAYKGATLEELAQKVGMDPDILRMNVSGYDKMSIAGKDTLFGKKVSKLNALGEEGPYYAVKGTTVAYNTIGGVEVTSNCQVMNTKGKLIDGLYAAGVEAQGNIMDGVSYTNVSGINLGWGYTTGRIAAQSAVEDIKK